VNIRSKRYSIPSSLEQIRQGKKLVSDLPERSERIMQCPALSPAGFSVSPPTRLTRNSSSLDSTQIILERLPPSPSSERLTPAVHLSLSLFSLPCLIYSLSELTPPIHQSFNSALLPSSALGTPHPLLGPPPLQSCSLIGLLCPSVLYRAAVTPCSLSLRLPCWSGPSTTRHLTLVNTESALVIATANTFNAALQRQIGFPLDADTGHPSSSFFLRRGRLAVSSRGNLSGGIRPAGR
jgi:hypothetical protein